MKSTIFSVLIVSAQLLLMACQPSGPRGNGDKALAPSLQEAIEKLIQGKSSQSSECFDIQSGILVEYLCDEVDVVIPDGVLGINDWVFYNRGLRSVVFPPTVVYVGKAAFSSNKLESVSLPHVIYIMDEAFMNNELSSVDLPEVSFIGTDAFAYNSLSFVKLPCFVKMGENVFSENDYQFERSLCL